MKSGSIGKKVVTGSNVISNNSNGVGNNGSGKGHKGQNSAFLQA